jgi:hypothetical protein
MSCCFSQVNRTPHLFKYFAECGQHFQADDVRRSSEYFTAQAESDVDGDTSDNESARRNATGRAGEKVGKAVPAEKKRKRPPIINLYEFEDRGMTM